jgi:spoIIIJ-associated protein
VQWVETTGRTIEDAKELALDQLGVDESEAEFEILEEPKTGLFGRLRADARIRARVVPKVPRPKQERRPRRGRSGDGRRKDGGDRKKGSGGNAPEPTTDDSPATPEAEGQGPDEGQASKPQGSSRKRGNRGRSGSKSGSSADNQEGNEMSDEPVSVAEQADIISEFLTGLLEALSVEGKLVRNQIDDDTIEIGVEGDDLGPLIGPKGQTLNAVHELSRTVLQRRATGRHEGRVRIDIGGYRHRRAEALARFVQAQAADVVEQGVARALEPMNAVDRKVVHDTINEIEGVSTISEGQDPNRRVVLVPADSEG